MSLFIGIEREKIANGVEFLNESQMKKVLFLLGLFATVSLSAQKKSIGLMPQAGYIQSHAEDVNYAGFQVGAVASFGLSERFAIHPGVSFARMSEESGTKDYYFLIPVYAMYEIPIREVRLNLGAGPFGQLGTHNDFGVSAEVGAEYKRWQLNVQFYQHLINGDPDTPERFAGLSLGYRFRLK